MKNIPGFSEDHEDWQDALMSLKDIYSRCSADGDRNAFASASMKILAPFISSSCTMATPDASLRWFGCFRYNYVPETKQIYLHFKNACCPESPFASMSDRFAELLLIADDIEKKGFAPLLIGCDSWLNELNSFKELFPLEYSKSFIISPPDSKGGYGWWGQFIDKNGKFSTKKAEKFEGKMEFQFRRIIAKCSYESFLCHIRSKIKDIDPDQHYCHR